MEDRRDAVLQRLALGALERERHLRRALHPVDLLGRRRRPIDRGERDLAAPVVAHTELTAQALRRCGHGHVLNRAIAPAARHPCGRLVTARPAHGRGQWWPWLSEGGGREGRG